MRNKDYFNRKLQSIALEETTELGPEIRTSTKSPDLQGTGLGRARSSVRQGWDLHMDRDPLPGQRGVLPQGPLVKSELGRAHLKGRLSRMPTNTTTVSWQCSPQKNWIFKKNVFLSKIFPF